MTQNPEGDTEAAEPDALAKYRDWLVHAEHQASMDFDKAIVTIAGGALGISLTLLRPEEAAGRLSAMSTLGWSWACLTASLLTGLASLIASRKALRKSIQQVDASTIYKEKPGGKYSTASEWLDYISAVLVVIGVALLAVFAWKNIGGLA